MERAVPVTRRSVLVALGVGLVLIALAVILTLSRSPLILAGAGSVRPVTYDSINRGDFGTCQGNEVLPRGTTAIRLWVRANVGPSVRVSAWSGARVLTRGNVGTGWAGVHVTVPVAAVPATVSQARVCVTVGRAVEAIGLIGEGRTSRETYGRIAIEYLRPGDRTWWSLAGSVAQRMSLGRAPNVAWIFLVPIVLMAMAAVLVSWTVIRQLGRRGWPAAVVGAPLRRRIPGPAWACVCVAFLSAASWSVVTPPFEVPDEPAHFAYTQFLAETGGLSKSDLGSYSQEELAAMEALELQGVRFDPSHGTISTAVEQQRLQRDLVLPLSRVGSGVGVAAPQPPLYYALQTVPYYLGSSGTLLDQLALMRLLSALMAGLTALFAFLFLREALPGVPWAWTVGGLCAALAPLVGFMSGAVNPDAMLCAVSAALFYCLARAFRRGLTPRTAIAIGAVSAIGFLTKLNFIGLAPGVLLALVLLARQAAQRSKRSAYGSLVLAVAVAGSPICVYAVINLLSNHPALGLLSTGIGKTSAHHGSIFGELVYIWQYFLPRLPGMRNDFPGIFTARQLWFNGAVGLYGWSDTYFPAWVYDVALIPAGLLAMLCARELLRARGALRSRAGELLAYVAMGAGVLVLIGADSYLEFPQTAAGYSEPRYLLPLAVLFAAVLALAARGAGRRWGPALGALIVLLILAHNIFSQLLVVGRFYG